MLLRTVDTNWQVVLSLQSDNVDVSRNDHLPLHIQLDPLPSTDLADPLDLPILPEMLVHAYIARPIPFQTVIFPTSPADRDTFRNGNGRCQLLPQVLESCEIASASATRGR